MLPSVVIYLSHVAGGVGGAGEVLNGSVGTADVEPRGESAFKNSFIFFFHFRKCWIWLMYHIYARLRRELFLNHRTASLRKALSELILPLLSLFRNL